MALAHRSDLTAQWLRSRVAYDAATGKMLWARCSQTWRNGSEVGYLAPSGYMVTNFGKSPYLVHRLVWLFVHGRWPAGEIDHINGRRDDNRLCNLREATRAQNARNRAAKNGRAIKGVTLTKRGKWQAQIRCDGKNLYIGTYETAAQAGAAYALKATELHGEFARLA